MKNIISIVLLSLIWGGAFAQSSDVVETKDVKVVKNQDNVDVSFKVLVGEKATKRNYSLTLTPVLYNGTESQEFMPIVVENRRIKLLRERQIISEGKKYQPKSEFISVENGQEVEYAVSVPYEAWMNGASVRLERCSEGCYNVISGSPELIAKDLKLIKDLTPLYEKHVAASGKVAEVNKKWDFGKEELTIIFKVKSTVIDKGLVDNAKVLDDIVRVVKQIESNPETSLNTIDITGFASPEGTLSQNIKLGEGRADALKSYLKEQLPVLTDSKFKIINGHENWDGLRKMVEASGMEYKQDVLELMNRVKPENGLKEQLVKLKWGVPYAYMYKNFYPELRNACYIAVYYDVKADYAADKINEAIGLINKKNYSEALPILLQHKDDSRAWNPIGVCYMMTKDYEQAKVYLKRAADGNNSLAKDNLRQIVEMGE